jgi:hypothetical protein
VTTFAPSAAEAFLLALIRERESGGNYTATNILSSASGAYQFIDSTWKYCATSTGVGTSYARALEAPAADQDFNALWLLRQVGPNSTKSWKASGPYPTLAGCEKAMTFA